MARLRHRDVRVTPKRFAISLLKQVDDKESIAMRRRMAGWNPSYLLKVLEIPA